MTCEAASPRLNKALSIGTLRCQPGYTIQRRHQNQPPRLNTRKQVDLKVQLLSHTDMNRKLNTHSESTSKLSITSKLSATHSSWIEHRKLKLAKLNTEKNTTMQGSNKSKSNLTRMPHMLNFDIPTINKS